MPISFSCRYFGLSKSGYYNWVHRKNIESNLQIKKKNLFAKIINLFKISDGTYGSPRIYHAMKKDGDKISQNTVEKYMRELELKANIKKKWRVQKLEEGQTYSIAGRVFVREDGINTNMPGELLAGDITYLKFQGKEYYLSIVMDLFNREIIGWSLDDTLQSKGVANALKKALEQRKVNQNTKVIFHSDRGSQYASEAYRKYLSANQITASMSRTGNYYDNIYVESWFKTFKYEFFFRKNFLDYDDFRIKTFNYIEAWYNRQRLHSSLDFLSPVQYKQLYQNAA